MPRMMTVWITSQWFQLARVAARCSGVEVPNTSPRIFSRSGALVKRLTIITTREAEHQHPSAEEEPVGVVEQVLEEVAVAAGHYGRIAVIDFGSESGQADDETGDKSPHAALG